MITGFEHAPSSDEEHKRVREALEYLQTKEIFSFFKKKVFQKQLFF